MTGTGRTDLIQHATCAAQRASTMQAALRSSANRLGHANAREPMPARLLVIVDDFRRRMLDALGQLTVADTAQLGSAWCRFLVRYEDHIEAIRQARCELAQDEYGEMPAPRDRALAAPGPRAECRRD
jgi:hypothetical protein